jgi:hypothetical protein
MTASTVTTFISTATGLAPAFLGLPYECALAYKASSTLAVTAQAVTTGALPSGLALDTQAAASGSLRITGTPTGLDNGTAGGHQVGTGNYPFTVTLTDSTGTSTLATSINVYASPTDPNYASASLSVAQQAAERNALDQNVTGH